MDDGSHDQRTQEILDRYSKYPKIKVHRLHSNYGSGIFAKNYGFMQA